MLPPSPPFLCPETFALNFHSYNPRFEKKPGYALAVSSTIFFITRYIVSTCNLQPEEVQL